MKIASLARVLLPLALLAALSAACGDETTGTGGSGATTLGSGGSGAGGDATTSTGSTGGGGMMGETSTLRGNVSRTAAIPQGLDGVGDLYVAVFEENPLFGEGPMAVGTQLIEDADFSDTSTKVPYVIEGLAYSPNKEFFVVAFLDDDGNADPASPGPKKPDLVTLDGIGPITVKVMQPGETQLDLVLNAEIPF